MKDILLGILLVTTLAFGTLYVRQDRKTHEAEIALASARTNAAELDARLSQQAEKAADLRKQLEDADVQVAEKGAALARLEQKLSNAVPRPTAPRADQQDSKEPAKSAGLFGDMLQKPEVKEMVKAQQKMVFSGMIDKNYAELFSSLGLSQEQSATLKDLVMKKMLVDSTMGVSLLGSDVDAAKRQEILQQAKTEKDGLNDQIKQFLGADNYAQFQTYEKTQPDRMGVSMFKDQLASGPNALQPDQEKQLIQALGEERQGFKFTTDFSDQSKMSGDFAAMFTDEKLNQWRQERDQLDERYLVRAQSILSPDQLTSFKTYLSSQDQMTEAGLKLAGQMFTSKKAQN